VAGSRSTIFLSRARAMLILTSISISCVEYDMGNAILPVYDYSPPAVTRTESGTKRERVIVIPAPLSACMRTRAHSAHSIAFVRAEVEVDTNIWDDPPENPSNLVTQPTADRKAFVIRYGTFNKIIEFLTSETPKGPSASRYPMHDLEFACVSYDA